MPFHFAPSPAWPSSSSPSLPRRRLIIAISLFSALSALGGSVELLVWRSGNHYLPPSLIDHTPFTSFLVPGLLLAIAVGGTSLCCALLSWRRARAAIDATLLAGGALTVWIVAEAAMLRGVHALHLLYGGLGAALLALGVSAGWGSRAARHRWVIAVTLAEAVGFLAPSCAGILSARYGVAEVPQAGLVVAAGFLEGLALGAGQAFALPLAVRRGRYALLTALGAGLVWASVMSVSLLVRGAALPPALGIAAAVSAGLGGLAAIGSAQWLELRHHTGAARRWIAWTALAWLVALPFSFAPGPFVDEATPLTSHFVLWGCGGLLMAYAMALVTWQGARRLSAEACAGGSRGLAAPLARAA